MNRKNAVNWISSIYSEDMEPTTELKLKKKFPKISEAKFKALITKTQKGMTQIEKENKNVPFSDDLIMDQIEDLIDELWGKHAERIVA